MGDRDGRAPEGVRRLCHKTIFIGSGGTATGTATFHLDSFWTALIFSLIFDGLFWGSVTRQAVRSSGAIPSCPASPHLDACRTGGRAPGSTPCCPVENSTPSPSVISTSTADRASPDVRRTHKRCHPPKFTDSIQTSNRGVRSSCRRSASRAAVAVVASACLFVYNALAPATKRARTERMSAAKAISQVWRRSPPSTERRTAKGRSRGKRLCLAAPRLSNHQGQLENGPH